MKATRKSPMDKRGGEGMLFLLPSLLFFAIFTFIPLVFSFYVSLTDYDGFSLKDQFAGLANFAKLFGDDYFRISIRNNFVYTVLYVPGVILAALASALALNKAVALKGTLRLTYFFPYLTSMVSVATVWGLLLNPSHGIINRILVFLGVDSPPGWLMSTKWAMVAIVMVSVWKNFGYYMIILLAGLQGIPKYLYESARIDGAGAINQFRFITLPSLSPILFLVTILTVISSFQVFDLVSVMTNGGPGRATNVLVYRIYQEAFINYKIGYASAIAVVLFVLVLTVTVVQFRLEEKWVNY